MKHRNLLKGFLLLFALTVFSPLVCGADPLDNWHLRNPLTPNVNVSAIAYGNNTYVAVGDWVMSSPDGVTWTKGTADIPDNLNLSAVVYGSDKFVAVGDSGRILTSADGATWTTQTSGTTQSLTGVAYGSGKFVAAGYNGTILVSADGITWAQQTSGTTNPFRTITYVNGKFMATGAWACSSSSTTCPTGKASTDGITWTDMSGSGTSIAYGNGKFVSVTNYDDFNQFNYLTSTDGNTWVSQSTACCSSWPKIDFSSTNSVVFGNNTFVAVSNQRYILTSTDGSTWTERVSDTLGNINALSYGNGRFVGVGDNGLVVASTDGASWSSVSGPVVDLGKIVFGNNTLVALGNSNTTLVTSTEGSTWIGRTLGPSITGIDYLVFDNGKFIVRAWDVAAQKTKYYSSTDGATWTETTANPSSFSMIAHGNNTYVGIADTTDENDSPVKRFYSSTDGSHWVPVFDEWGLGTGATVTFGNNTFVAVLNQGVYSSPDGVTWMLPVSGVTINANALAFGNNVFAAAGSERLYTSNDAKTWTPRAFFPTASLTDIVFAYNTFVAVGAGGTILQSDPVSASAASTAQPDISANTSSINLGSVVVGSTSSQVLAISNKGSASLTVSAIALSGANSSEMSQTNNCSVVPAGSSCTIVVSFSPASLGAKTATLGITSNDPDTATLSIALSATGVGVPNITLTASAVDFGSVTVGSKASQAITVSNSGSADLKISMLKVSGLHANEITQTNNCAAVTAGSSCTINLAFSPKFPGSKSVTMTIASNDLLSPVIDIQVTGTANSNGSTAANPDISVKTSSMTFDGASTKSLTVSNKGKAELYISSVSIDGTDSDQFIENDNCLTVAPGSSCTISVEFAPDSFGTKGATLTILSNDPGSQTTTVSLSGSGGAPKIVVKPATLSLSARVQKSASKAVVISNSGKATLEINSINITGTDMGEFSQSSSCSTIAPKKTCKVTVTFAPTSTGKKNATLSISSNDPDKPAAAVALSGVASQAKKQKIMH